MEKIHKTTFQKTNPLITLISQTSPRFTNRLWNKNTNVLHLRVYDKSIHREFIIQMVSSQTWWKSLIIIWSSVKFLRKFAKRGWKEFRFTCMLGFFFQNHAWKFSNLAGIQRGNILLDKSFSINFETFEEVVFRTVLVNTFSWNN